MVRVSSRSLIAYLGRVEAAVLLEAAGAWEELAEPPQAVRAALHW